VPTGVGLTILFRGESDSKSYSMQATRTIACRRTTPLCCNLHRHAAAQVGNTINARMHKHASRSSTLNSVNQGCEKVRSKFGQNGPGRMRDIKHLYKIREVEPITASAVVPSQSKVETKDARMTRSIVQIVCVRASLALRPTEADVHRLGCMLGMAVRAEYFGRAERTQQIAYHSQDWQCQIASSWPWHVRTQPPQYRS
jgi:hypothetical protein